MAKSNTLFIKTPEGISFPLLLAGPISRLIAWIIDLACISVIVMALNLGIQIAGLISPDFSQAAAILSYFLVSIGYGIFCEWYYKGQTVGKRLLSIRVMDAQGLRLQFSQIVIRNLLRFIDSLPAVYLVGGISCLLSPKSQRLGDLAANTIAIREPKMAVPDLEQLLTHKYNSLRGHPHLVARLRQHTSHQEADIALRALLRRDELDPPCRVDLFARIASHIKKITPIPQEVTDGISDEQFVRNLVEVLFLTNRATSENRTAKAQSSKLAP
jgi:uncharacterized RDD family membrane protein YckC